MRLDLGPFKQRVLLAALLCKPNTIMSADQLMDVIWGRGKPRTARKNLQVYVSALRKLAGNRVQHVAYGYSLQVSTQESDLLRFADLAEARRKATHAGDLNGSRLALGEALWLTTPR